MKKVLSYRWTKVVVFVLCLVPLARLGWRAYQQDLTANPIEYITHFTGDWTIRAGARPKNAAWANFSSAPR